jgi:hypothetical protein
MNSQLVQNRVQLTASGAQSRQACLPQVHLRAGRLNANVQQVAMRAGCETLWHGGAAKRQPKMG